jgi:four helix bundle protein
MESNPRRASVSVMSSIAGGFERRSRKEFAQFLSVAKGSPGEVRAQLYAAMDQCYIDRPAFEQLSELARETSRLVGGLARYLRAKQETSDGKEVASKERKATSDDLATRNSQLDTRNPQPILVTRNP